MISDGKFSAETVLTLSKRSALLCSNPDCGALTSGPTAETNSSLNIGEAAHIYGRTNASARYKPDLTIAEVSDITNGIWLCRSTMTPCGLQPSWYSNGAGGTNK